jgi:hypothetical protein
MKQINDTKYKEMNNNMLKLEKLIKLKMNLICINKYKKISYELISHCSE